MTKIKHTRNHTIQVVKTIDGMFPHTGWNDILVTDGELMLINPDKDVIDTLTSHSRLATEFKKHSIKTGKNHIGIDLWWKRNETKLLGVPIVTSRTEKIEIGDWYYTPFGSIAQYMGKVDVHRLWIKIIVLPEHFSPDQLNQLVKGELKTGKCVVECEIHDEWLKENPPFDNNKSKHYHQIKLNTHIIPPYIETNGLTISNEVRSYATIHSLEIKKYTRQEVKNLFMSMASSKGYEGTSTYVLEWFEQNVS